MKSPAQGHKLPLFIALAISGCATAPIPLPVAIPKAETLTCSQEDIQQRTSADSTRTTRTQDEAETVMTCNRRAIEALYQKEVFAYGYEEKGKVTVEMKVETSGDVTDATIVSSELKRNDRFHDELITLLKSLKFAKSSVETTLVSVPLYFKPPVGAK